MLLAQLLHLCFTGAFITFEPAFASPLAMGSRLALDVARCSLVALLAVAQRRPTQQVAQAQTP